MPFGRGRPHHHCRPGAPPRRTDLVEIDAGDRREGRALAGRIDGEAGVVSRQIDLAEKGVGGLDRADPRKPQFLRQPVLKRLERPL
jgi:hypothetical protein